MINQEDLINKVKAYNKFLNPDTLSKAYNFALKAHANQQRISGDPFLIHRCCCKYIDRSKTG